MAAIATALTGLLFLTVGLVTLNDIPMQYISSPVGYIRGDAYNYMIEASLLAGEISQGRITAAIYLVGGAVLLNAGVVLLAWLWANRPQPAETEDSSTVLDSVPAL